MNRMPGSYIIDEHTIEYTMTGKKRRANFILKQMIPTFSKLSYNQIKNQITEEDIESLVRLLVLSSGDSLHQNHLEARSFATINGKLSDPVSILFPCKYVICLMYLPEYIL